MDLNLQARNLHLQVRIRSWLGGEMRVGMAQSCALRNETCALFK